MEISVSEQLKAAALALLVGGAAGLLYDFFRELRRRAGSGAVTLLADALFWLAAFAALFSLGLAAGGGEQRLFLAAFALLGALAYFLTLSRPCRKVWGAVLSALGFAFYWASRPAAWLLGLLKTAGKFMKKFFSSGAAWYRIVEQKVFKQRPRAPADFPGGNSVENQARRYIYEDRSFGAAGLRGGVSGDAADQGGDRQGQ